MNFASHGEVLCNVVHYSTRTTAKISENFEDMLLSQTHLLKLFQLLSRRLQQDIVPGTACLHAQERDTHRK